ncbi:MAG: class I SAM-dependent methyltransferase [Mycobacteriales bacterium]
MPHGDALTDFVRSGNQAVDPDLYEIENQALDRRGLVLDAMRELAPWKGKRLVDLGCGSGYWLPGYADEAATVIGVEPDDTLLDRARGRDPRVPVTHGSAEHLPLPDASVDVVHARFAYFFGPGSEAGLAEVDRVLAPGGRLVVVDNDPECGEFAALLAAGYPVRNVDDWWTQRGAERRAVLSDWQFDQRADLEAVLRLEFPARLAQDWLAEHPDRTALSYGYLLYATTPKR